MMARREVIIGPYHEYLLEPERITLILEDNVVKEVDIRLGLLPQGHRAPHDDPHVQAGRLPI